MRFEENHFTSRFLSRKTDLHQPSAPDCSSKTRQTISLAVKFVFPFINELRNLKSIGLQDQWIPFLTQFILSFYHQVSGKVFSESGFHGMLENFN
ncbi:hypothetical protein KQX54_012899 [Cotesia glomerata]|uniref:Uncharacterized protein n=1 Tax=Cotesia glomerata TaxID=32391 RepID=A0AAV7J408_COTGL|nr:hypothetical protein KQX54_012899 [Cotesia glomerata]